MATCATGCVTDLPPVLLTGCAPTLKKGGISHIIIATCDIDPVIDGVVGPGQIDLLVQANLDVLYPTPTTSTCQLRIVCVDADKPAAERNYKWLGGCHGEVPTDGTVNLNVRSFHINPNMDSMWTSFLTKPTNYKVAYVTGEGDVSQFYPVTKSTIDKIIEPQTAANAPGSTKYEGILSFSAIDIQTLVEASATAISGAPAPPAPQFLIEYLMEHINDTCA